ncbi:MAG: zinc-ribbon domain-containing protein, partial [Clostridiales bacterium]|nr:zinc-ribbon domain-containing protein [Clostridiales bacterium]
MAKYCSKCGEALLDGDRFCARCGTPVVSAAANAPGVPSRQTPPPSRSAVPSFEESARMTVGTGVTGTRSVSGEMQTGGSVAAFGPKGWIKGTAATLLGGLGNLLVGFFKVFTKPKALLFTVAISALWIWLNHLRLFEGLEGITDFLSKFTYAGGGTNGSVVEIIGGTIGKGVVGAGLCSILYGGIGKMIRGIRNIFTEPGFNLGAAIL